MNHAERRRFEELQVDRRDIERAAAWLRAHAWRESYAGSHDKYRAFMLASLVLQLDRVDSAVRSEAVRVSRWLLGERDSQHRYHWMKTPKTFGLVDGGAPRFTPHDRRRFFASTALAGGVSPLEVSHWLGRR